MAARIVEFIGKANMTCAVVENQNGKKTHHTNVEKCSVGSRRSKTFVRLTLCDGSEEIIEGAVSGRLVNDTWYVENSGLVPN